MQPYLLSKVREQEAKLERLRNLRDQYNPDTADEEAEEKEHGFELVEPEMIHRVVPKPSRQVREFLFAVHDAEYNKAWNLYLTLKRQWEASCGNTKLFDPFNHQRIAAPRFRPPKLRLETAIAQARHREWTYKTANENRALNPICEASDPAPDCRTQLTGPAPLRITFYALRSPSLRTKRHV